MAYLNLALSFKTSFRISSVTSRKRIDIMILDTCNFSSAIIADSYSKESESSPPFFQTYSIGNVYPSRDEAKLPTKSPYPVNLVEANVVLDPSNGD